MRKLKNLTQLKTGIKNEEKQEEFLVCEVVGRHWLHNSLPRAVRNADEW